NIQANQLLYRAGLVAQLVEMLSNLPLAVIFYELFKVVNRRVTLLVVFSTLVMTAIGAANMLVQFIPLVMFHREHYANNLAVDQLQALLYLALELGPISYHINSGVFAVYGFSIGYLVFTSTFLPRSIGVLLAIGALSYLTYGLASMISPEFAARLVPYIQLP